MFTGIVTHRGRLLAVRPTEGGGRRLVLEPTPALDDARLGDSIAVDGVCLTVAGLDGPGLAFDVVPETLRRTTLGARRVGDDVNLEPSLRLGDRMGGHLVQGHVEGVGEVVASERQGEDVRLRIRVDAALAGAFLPKGSVAVDGVSLTVGEVGSEGGRDWFHVYLVPHTLAVTGLGERRPGDRVNIEPDVLGRTVARYVEQVLEPIVEQVVARRLGGGPAGGGPARPEPEGRSPWKETASP